MRVLLLGGTGLTGPLLHKSVKTVDARSSLSSRRAREAPMGITVDDTAYKTEDVMLEIYMRVG